MKAVTVHTRILFRSKSAICLSVERHKLWHISITKVTWEKFATRICSLSLNLLLIYFAHRNKLVWRPKSYWNQCKNSGSTTNNPVLFLALCPSSSFLGYDLLKRTKHSLRQISICSFPVLQVILLFSLDWKPAWCSPPHTPQLAQQGWLTLPSGL